AGCRRALPYRALPGQGARHRASAPAQDGGGLTPAAAPFLPQRRSTRMSLDNKTTLIRLPIELRWRDLDALNHVNNSNFMTYLEEARIRWFQSLGEPWMTDAVMPLLAAVQMNYRVPIPYPARVVVELSGDRVGNSSVTLGHRIASEDGT